MAGGGNVRRPLFLGALRVDLIEACLGIELPAGDVVFYERAQEHAFSKDPSREPTCSPHLKDVVADPTHIGQQPDYVGKGFDLVRVVSNGPIVLIGMSITPLKSGLYAVRSAYQTNPDTLERRVRKGFTVCVEGIKKPAIGGE